MKRGPKKRNLKDTSKNRTPRSAAEVTLWKRIEILIYLKIYGDRSLGEINHFFKYKESCLSGYLYSLMATGNIERVERVRRKLYRFIKFYE